MTFSDAYLHLGGPPAFAAHGGCQRGCQRSGTYLLASSLPIDGGTIPVQTTTDVGGTPFVFDATITATVER
jgi:hypothetical protein